MPHARLRQAWVQLHKRSAVNLRPVVGIRPRVMTKTLALGLMAAGRSEAVRSGLGATVETLPEEIAGRARRDRDRAWWGYEFPVQTRWSFSPAGTANTVVTAFAARALFESGSVHGELLAGVGTRLASMAERRTDRTYLRYVPGSDAQIHNASALGAAVLADLGGRLGLEDWVALAFDAGRTILAAQRD